MVYLMITLAPPDLVRANAVSNVCFMWGQQMRRRPDCGGVQDRAQRKV